MSDWWSDEHLGDVSRDREKAERLANLLSRLPGTRAEKVDFLEQHMTLLEAEADREGKTKPRERAGAIKSYAFRLWRRHLTQGPMDGVTRSFAERENDSTRDRQREKWGDPHVRRGPDRGDRPTPLRLLSDR